MHMKKYISFTTTFGSFFILALLMITGCSPRPIEITSVEGPDSLNVDEAGDFTATVLNSDDPEKRIGKPVEYTWTWGDGATDDGTLGEEESGRSLMGNHAFSDDGEYTIEITATNRKDKQASGQTSVVVVAPPEIVTMNASSTNVQMGDQVNFSANVRGTQPLQYEWSFGDGSTARGENASHAYQSDGMFSVSLEVTNRAGSASESLTMNVSPATGPCDRISELNTVNFEFDKSDLDNEAQDLLSENVSTVEDCPNVNIRIDAYTDHVGGDQYNLRLSERRARSVEDFYTTAGIVASRLATRGLGKAPQPCMQEDPGPGCRRNRRAESIPLDQ
jgi:outer membrane protein OmpA-like peptidoglycan-associated protein